LFAPAGIGWLRAGEKLIPNGSAADERYVRQLLTILRKTESPDVFVLTLRQLEGSGADPRVIVPLAIRHAERVGIFDRHLFKEKGAKVARATAIAELLEDLGKKAVEAGKASSAEKALPGITATDSEPLSMEESPTVVPPWVTERLEEKCRDKDHFRTPILPPIKEGERPTCEDPPDEARILRALSRAPHGVPYFCEVARDNVQIVTELMVDRIDSPRFFPLVGVAQLHHCHWKCTVSFNEVIESGYPFPFRLSRPRVQVVYIDLDHLHLCPDGKQK